VSVNILLALGNEGSSGLAKFTSWVYNAPMSTKVELTRQAQKQLRQVPGTSQSSSRPGSRRWRPVEEVHKHEY